MKIFPVSPAKEGELLRRMQSLDIHEEDIQEKFVRSQGRGGQKVNKASTCVYLKHLPTGVEVKCQRGRSQALNRYYARVILIKKIETMIRGRESEELQRIERVRRQKRRRSRKAKEKMLKKKRTVSEKKRLRHRITEAGPEVE